MTGRRSRFAKGGPAESIRLGRTLFVLFAFAVVNCLCLQAAAGDRAQSAAIVLVPPDSLQAVFEARGLGASLQVELAKLPRDDSRWPQIFGVSVSGPAESSVPGQPPPMLGTYEVTADAVRFKPRFPLERGIEYRAVFNPPASIASAKNLRLEAKIVLPAAGPHPAARVVAIYPSSAALPENILRFYLHFSAPMSQGKSYDYVRLRDENGSEIERPFLELPQELWSPDGRRLTLLFEPGRIKRGLVPRTEQGPILVAGHSYTLSIDGNWPDADGHPLQKGVHKTFRALPPEMNQLDPQKWTLDAPRSRSRDSLVVRFPKALDHAMLEHVLTVVRLDGAHNGLDSRSEIAGKIEVSDEEARWSFEPREPWRVGRYALVVPTTLEDRAGNSVRLPFEVDLNRPHAPKPAAANVDIEFTVRGKL